MWATAPSIRLQWRALRSWLKVRCGRMWFSMAWMYSDRLLCCMLAAHCRWNPNPSVCFLFLCQREMDGGEQSPFLYPWHYGPPPPNVPDRQVLRGGNGWPPAHGGWTPRSIHLPCFRCLLDSVGTMRWCGHSAWARVSLAQGAGESSFFLHSSPPRIGTACRKISNGAALPAWGSRPSGMKR